MTRTVLETERLALRELEPSDEDALTAMFADPDVMRWIGSGGVRTREDARRTIDRERDRYAERGWGEWATCLRDTRETIGLCGLIAWPDVGGNEEVEVAYLLARDAWGHGYATEAARAIAAWAIRELGRKRLISLVHHDNVASAAVARKVGMSWESDVAMFGVELAMYSMTVSLGADQSSSS